MPDVEVLCGACKGARFNSETLEVTFRGKTIADVLDMSVEEGRRLLRGRAGDRQEDRRAGRSRPRLPHARPVRDDPLRRRGAADQDRDRADQAAARRSTRSTSSTSRRRACTSPTSSGCSRRLNRLVDAGHTVLVIEHHLDVIKTADHVIDLGPKAATPGAGVVATRHARRDRRVPAVAHRQVPETSTVT